MARGGDSECSDSVSSDTVHDDEGSDAAFEAHSESESEAEVDSDFEETPKKKQPAAKKSQAAAKKTGKAAQTKGKTPTTKKAAADNKENVSKRAAASDGAGSTAKKAKVETVSDAKAVGIVKDYMLQQNRPYSHLNVFDNLHGIVKKASVPKILNQLSESGVLQRKDFGKVKALLPYNVFLTSGGGRLASIWPTKQTSTTLIRARSTPWTGRSKKWKKRFRR